MIQKIEIERFSVTSTKPFDEVLVAINDAVGHPEMVAKAVVFLASDESSYNTGSEFFVDGGFAQV